MSLVMLAFRVACVSRLPPLNRLAQSDSLSQVEEALSTVTSKAGEMNAEYGLVNQLKELVAKAGDLSNDVIDKALTYADENDLVGKAAEKAKELAVITRTTSCAAARAEGTLQGRMARGSRGWEWCYRRGGSGGRHVSWKRACPILSVNSCVRSRSAPAPLNRQRSPRQRRARNNFRVQQGVFVFFVLHEAPSLAGRQLAAMRNEGRLTAV